MPSITELGFSRYNRKEVVDINQQIVQTEQMFPDGSITPSITQDNQTFYQAAAPLTGKAGDIWYDTDDNNKPYRWSGSGWVSVQDTGTAIPSATNWSQTMVWSATDSDTVAWTAGSIITNATTYSIDAGNTGNMAATTYIYLDTGVSSTVLQTTTTGSTAVGSGKLLISVAKNVSSPKKAEFVAFNGYGFGTLIAADNIAANTITVNELAAGTLSVANLTAGTVTSKDILLAIAAGTGDVAIRAGKTDFTNTESGFILGLDDSDSDRAKFYIGDATTYFNWSGTGIAIAGSLTPTTGSSLDGQFVADSTLTNTKIDVANFMAVPSDENMVLYFSFDEGTGATVKDTSNSALTGTVDGATYVDGVSGQSLDFDGTNDFVSIADNAAIQNIWDGGGSVSVWINADANAGSRRICDKTNWDLQVGNLSGGGFDIIFTQKFSGTAGSWQTPNNLITTDTWHHVSVVYDNSSVNNNPSIYIDGILQGLTEISTPVGTRTSDVGSDLYIGNESTSTFDFDGTIDEVRFYNTSLILKEVQALYLNINPNAKNVITASRIAALTITAAEIAASTITSEKMSVSQLSAIAADLGAITAGTIVLPSGGYVRSGQTDYSTGTGFWLGSVGGTPKFSIGDGGAVYYMEWDGTTLNINGSLNGLFEFGGDGSDGALSVGAGVTTTLNSDTIYNYSSISVNATGTLTFTGQGIGMVNCSGDCTIAGTVELRYITESQLTRATRRDNILTSQGLVFTANAGGAGGNAAGSGGAGGAGGTSTVAGGGTGGAGGTAPGGSGSDGAGGGSSTGGGGGGGGAAEVTNNGTAGSTTATTTGGAGGIGANFITIAQAGGSGGGGGGGYNTGTGGAGASGGQGGGMAGNGGVGGSSGANGGNGGVGGTGGPGGQSGSTGNGGVGGVGGAGYTNGGAGGAGGNTAAVAGSGGTGGAGGKAKRGTGGNGGAGGSGGSGANSGSGGVGGVGYTGGNGGNGGTVTSGGGAAGNGGAGGAGQTGSTAFVLYVKGTMTLTGATVNAQGGTGGNGGNGVSVNANGGNGGRGGDGGDVIMLCLGTLTGTPTINNDKGTGGTAGTASGSGTAGTAGLDGANGAKFVAQILNT